MYPLLLTIGFCAVYIFLYLLFPLFFKDKVLPFAKRSIISLGVMIASASLVWFFTNQISDLDWSNRFLHVFGGGFLSFLVCFLVVQDTKLNIGKFKFFVFSFLIVLSLGVANEILEYALQEFTTLSFANTANDTWMDLISNCIGALFGAILLLPFIKPLRP